MRVAPGLVAVAALGPRTVLLETVAVAVSMLVDPLQAAFRDRLERQKRRGVADPPVLLRQEPQISRRCVRRAGLLAGGSGSEMLPLPNAHHSGGHARLAHRSREAYR